MRNENMQGFHTFFDQAIYLAAVSTTAAFHTVNGSRGARRLMPKGEQVQSFDINQAPFRQVVLLNLTIGMKSRRAYHVISQMQREAVLKHKHCCQRNGCCVECSARKDQGSSTGTYKGRIRNQHYNFNQ